MLQPWRHPGIRNSPRSVAPRLRRFSLQGAGLAVFAALHSQELMSRQFTDFATRRGFHKAIRAYGRATEAGRLLGAEMHGARREPEAEDPGPETRPRLLGL